VPDGGEMGGAGVVGGLQAVVEVAQVLRPRRDNVVVADLPAALHYFLRRRYGDAQNAVDAEKSRPRCGDRRDDEERGGRSGR
jgi:hypothetical protein